MVVDKKKLKEYSEKLYNGLRKQYNESGKYSSRSEIVRVSPSSDQHKDVCKNANWKCEICRLKYTEASSGFEIHHIDGNRENPKTNNLALLCATHHSEIHGIARAKMDNYKKKHSPKKPGNKETPGGVEWAIKQLRGDI